MADWKPKNRILGIVFWKIQRSFVRSYICTKRNTAETQILSKKKIYKNCLISATLALEFIVVSGHDHRRMLGPHVPFLLCLLDGRVKVNIQRMKSSRPLDSEAHWPEVKTQNKEFNQNITDMVIFINTETGTSSVLILGASCFFKKKWVTCEEMHLRANKTSWKFRVLSPGWKKKSKWLTAHCLKQKGLHFFL